MKKGTQYNLGRARLPLAPPPLPRRRVDSDAVSSAASVVSTTSNPTFSANPRAILSRHWKTGSVLAIIYYYIIIVRAPYQDKTHFISAHGRGGHREPRHPSRHAPHVWEQPPFYRLVVAARVRRGCSLVYPILGGGPLGYGRVRYDVISSFWYLSRARGRGLGWVGNGSRHLPGSP